MIYQHIMCLGDSQTFGARATLGYPEYLPQIMKENSSYVWSTINKGINGEKAIDVLRRVDDIYTNFVDVKITFFFIGTNDCNRKTLTKPEVFENFYRQILDKLNIYQQHIFLGTIPSIYPQEGHLPYDNNSIKHREVLNKIIEKLSNEYKLPLVDLGDISKDKYLDSVHLSNEGNKEIAERFKDILLQTCKTESEI